MNDISKDSDIVEKIGEIIQNLPETEVAEQYKIDQLINSIIAKKSCKIILDLVIPNLTHFQKYNHQRKCKND